MIDSTVYITTISMTKKPYQLSIALPCFLYKLTLKIKLIAKTIILAKIVRDKRINNTLTAI